MKCIIANIFGAANDRSKNWTIGSAKAKSFSRLVKPIKIRKIEELGKFINFSFKVLSLFEHSECSIVGKISQYT